MKLTGIRQPGVRLVEFQLDPKTALHVWFHLHASMHAEETTRASRIVVAGVLPALGRAIAETGYMPRDVITQFAEHMQSKPAPRPLDDTVESLIGKA